MVWLGTCMLALSWILRLCSSSSLESRGYVGFLSYVVYVWSPLEVWTDCYTLGYMTKTLNQIIFFPSTKIRIFFSATLGIRIFFLEKKHNPTPLFSNFLFANLFSIKFLYFFIISSLFPYFNLFVSIFIKLYRKIDKKGS
jgi:hypothetical protein